MAAYAKEKGITDKPASLTLETPSGNSVLVLDKDQPVAARSFKLSPGLKLNAASDERVFVRVSIAAKPRIQPIQPVATNGLAIDRFYHRILPDGTEEILTEPRVGDLIRVSLRVTLPRDGTSYVVVEDPLASLFETVNSDFQSQRSAAGVSGSENDWSVSHSELRSDRAVFFLDHVRRGGTHTLSYLARCTIAGRATAPPAKVESMYDPEKFALSASRIFAAN